MYVISLGYIWGMAKDKRYRTLYLPDGLELGIERWMEANGVEAFNLAVVSLIKLGLGDQAISIADQLDELQQFKQKVTKLLRQQGVEI